MTNHESGSSIPKPEESEKLVRDVQTIGAEPTLAELAEKSRKMLESDAADQYRNPKADLLADKRKTLEFTVGELDKSKLSLELAAMCSAISDVYALSNTVRLPLNDYVKAELAARNRSPYLVTAPKNERAAYSVMGIGLLQNAFKRARLNKATLSRNPDTLEDFKSHNQSHIWDNITDENTLLAAIDCTYDIIRIMNGREVVLHTAGEINDRLKADQEDEKIANKWLEELKEEYKVQGKIRQPSRAGDAANSLRQRVKQEK